MSVETNRAVNAIMDEFAPCHHGNTRDIDALACEPCQSKWEQMTDTLIREAQREIAEPLLSWLERFPASRAHLLSCRRYALGLVNTEPEECDCGYWKTIAEAKAKLGWDISGNTFADPKGVTA